ncbi:MAG: pyridoxamine 5'-phosphate oxidase family protein, partial [Bacteroidota bacterium]
SPKEIFTYSLPDSILVANVASPQTVKNIRENPQVCISFIDILVQKGYQLKGEAQILIRKQPDFVQFELPLLELTEGKFPFASITLIQIESAKKILAPRYHLYPETTEEEQIHRAKQSYGF